MSSWGMPKNVAASVDYGAALPDATVPPKPRSSLASLAEKVSVKPSRIESVKVDGLVLLKIIKHCTESLPELCSGSLLGMDIDQKLEVTNSFPSPEAVADEGADGTKYQFEMLKLLRDINVDCNPVGWYRSTYMGSFCTSDLVNQLFQYQEELDEGPIQKSVVLVYDPFQTKKGNLALRAYRLSDDFMGLLRGTKRSPDAPNVCTLSPAVVAAVDGLRGDGSAVMATATDDQLTANDIFEEVPIEISNAHLFTVLIEDFKEMNASRLDVDFDRLNLSTNPYLEKNFEFLVEEVDNLANEQQKKQREKRYIQKNEQEQIKWITQRRMENRLREERGEPILPEDGDASLPMFQPLRNSSQLESLLIRKQIGIYTDQINKFTGAGFSKLYLSSAIQGQQPEFN